MRFLLIISLLVGGPLLHAQTGGAITEPLYKGLYEEEIDKLIPEGARKDAKLSGLYHKLRSLQNGTSPATVSDLLKEIGRRYDALDYYDSSLVFFDRAAAIARQHNMYFYLALAYLNEGIAHKHHGHYTLALSTLDSAVRIFEKSDSTHLRDRFLYSAYNTMGNCNNEIYNHTRALECIEEAKAFAERLNENEHRLGMLYNNLGITHAALDNYQEARESYHASMYYKKLENDTLAYFNTCFNLGNLFRNWDSQDSALYYWETSLQGALRYGGTPYHISNPSIALARYYIERSQTQKAASYVEIADYQVDQLKNLDALAEYHLMKANYHRNIGEHEVSTRHYQRYIALADTIVDTQMTQRVLDIHQAYDSERKKQQISELNVLNTLQELQINQSRIFIIITVIGLVVLAVVAWVLHSRYKIKKESEEKIKMLMRELHHRVKNNMQVLSDLLSLQSAKIVDANAREAVKAGEDRVRAMALIHKDIYLSDELKDIDMSNFINKLVRNLMTSYGYTEKQLQLQLEAEALLLDVDKAIPLGLIINELVSNAFKYAFPDNPGPVLQVSLKKKNEQEAVLIVSDNGNGPSVEPKNKNSFGLKLVDMLTRQLQGTIERDTGAGMVYKLQFRYLARKR